VFLQTPANHNKRVGENFQVQAIVTPDYCIPAIRYALMRRLIIIVQHVLPVPVAITPYVCVYVVVIPFAQPRGDRPTKPLAVQKRLRANMPIFAKMCSKMCKVREAASLRG